MLGDKCDDFFCTLGNRQQAVGDFILYRKYWHRIQNNAVFIKNILKAPLRIWIFFCLQTQVLQHRKIRKRLIRWKKLNERPDYFSVSIKKPNQILFLGVHINLFVINQSGFNTLHTYQGKLSNLNCLRIVTSKSIQSLRISHGSPTLFRFLFAKLTWNIYLQHNYAYVSLCYIKSQQTHWSLWLQHVKVWKGSRIMTISVGHCI